MWENILKDPFMKVILVVFIGILAFGILFSLVGGNTYMGGMSNYNGAMSGGGHMGLASGFNFGGIITGLLMLLINILILVLVIAVVAGIIVWVKNNMLAGNNAKLAQMFNNDPVLRTAIIITAAVVGLVLIFALLNGFMGNGMIGQPGYGMHSPGYGVSFGITGLIMSLIRVLMFILVVSLIIAAIVYIRDQYNKGTMTSTAKIEVTTSTDNDTIIDNK